MSETYELGERFPSLCSEASLWLETGEPWLLVERADFPLGVLPLEGAIGAYLEGEGACGAVTGGAATAVVIVISRFGQQRFVGSDGATWCCGLEGGRWLPGREGVCSGGGRSGGEGCGFGG